MNGKTKMVRVSWMAGALLPLWAGFGGAANRNATLPQTPQPMPQNQQVATAPEPTAQAQPQLESAQNMIGAKVVNSEGRQLGTVKDVVLTPDRQSVNYVVLSHGDKYFAVPWSQLAPGKNNKTLVLQGHVTKADLDRAPGFNKKHWPATASANWLGTERSTGMAPAGGTMPSGSATLQTPAERGTNVNPGYGTAQPMNVQHLRLSKLLGTTVQDAQNDNVGKLNNAMIDMHQGKMAYGIVAARHGLLGAGKDYVAVPWSALNWTGQPGMAKVNVDRQTLASVAFSRNNFPNLANPQYRRQLFAQFQATPYWETPSLGFIPGQDNQNGNQPSSEMTAPDTGRAVPNTTAPNAATPQMVADGYGLAGPYGFNPAAVQTFQGTISQVTVGPVPGSATVNVGLLVRADNGEIIRVYLGPRAYLESQHMFFRPGEPVTVTGSKIDHHKAYVASQVRTPYGIFNLRTPDGTPLWILNPLTMPPAYGRGYDRYAYPYRH